MADDHLEVDNASHHVLQLFVVNLNGCADFLAGGRILFRNGGQILDFAIDLVEAFHLGFQLVDHIDDVFGYEMHVLDVPLVAGHDIGQLLGLQSQHVVFGVDHRHDAVDDVHQHFQIDGDAIGMMLRLFSQFADLFGHNGEAAALFAGPGRFDGGVERQEAGLSGNRRYHRGDLVDTFNAPETYTPYMILSLKAGGVGLNLTAANQVIHFDRWWNPAIENQATDRAFRIGQEKNVFVYKFVTSGTIEEKIDQMLLEKLQLSTELITETSGEQWLTEMSNEELKQLFTLEVNP